MKSSYLLSILMGSLVLLSCSWAMTKLDYSSEVNSVPVRFDYTAEEIRKTCTSEQEKALAGLGKVAAVTAEMATFENTVKAMEFVLTEFSNNLEPMNFLKYVSDKKDLRAAADECETAIQKMHVDIFVREDLFAPLKAYEAKGEPLGEVDAHLLKEYLTDFRRNGLELPAEERKVFVQKKKKLVELQTEFDKNLVEWKDSLTVTAKELEGLPDDYINALEKTPEGNYLVTMKYPDYFPFMQNSKDGDVRKRLQHKFFNRGGDRNKDLLEEAISLRHELATMLGKRTHAEFVLEKRMAKNPATVHAFLKDLTKKLKPKGQENLQELLELKREELGDPTIKNIHAWDWRYYENLLKKTKYQIDHQLIKQYFPLQVVLKGMFEIYETLLSVDFIELKNAPKWFDGVQAFAVKNRETGEVISYFYMDLFPREGKYGHAAAFTLQSGYLKRSGSYQLPVSSIVANFNAPTEESPSLLLHSQVETLFHEFGHIMHQVLTTAIYATFSGTSVKRDFVEAPSQMLENWVWEKEPLASISGHYKDPSKKLPDELLDKLLKAKLVNVGIRYLRQLFFATLDMTYHTSASVNSTQIYRDLIKEIMLIPIPEGTQPQASFGHLMGGYDAGYYGYLWSEVYAQDMYTRFVKEGLLNPKTGGDYLKYILQPGGTVEPLGLITKFIGREPNNKAFLNSIGLGRAVAGK